MAVASPCINICRMSPQTGLCEGCLRSLDEITRWSRADDDERERILARVSERRETFVPRQPNAVRAEPVEAPPKLPFDRLRANG